MTTDDFYDKLLKRISNEAEGYKCTNCGKSFENEDKLDDHLYSQHGKRPRSMGSEFYKRFGFEYNIDEPVDLPVGPENPNYDTDKLEQSPEDNIFVPEDIDEDNQYITNINKIIFDENDTLEPVNPSGFVKSQSEEYQKGDQIYHEGGISHHESQYCPDCKKEGRSRNTGYPINPIAAGDEANDTLNQDEHDNTMNDDSTNEDVGEFPKTEPDAMNTMDSDTAPLSEEATEEEYCNNCNGYFSPAHNHEGNEVNNPDMSTGLHDEAQPDDNTNEFGYQEANTEEDESANTSDVLVSESKKKVSEVSDGVCIHCGITYDKHNNPNHPIEGREPTDHYFEGTDDGKEADQTIGTDNPQDLMDVDKSIGYDFTEDEATEAHTLYDEHAYAGQYRYPEPTEQDIVDYVRTHAGARQGDVLIGLTGINAYNQTDSPLHGAIARKFEADWHRLLQSGRIVPQGGFGLGYMANEAISNEESYPWEDCINDNKDKGMDSAKKICGSIKAKYGENDDSYRTKCETCNKVFDSPDERRKHEFSAHGPDGYDSYEAFAETGGKYPSDEEHDMTELNDDANNIGAVDDHIREPIGQVGEAFDNVEDWWNNKAKKGGIGKYIGNTRDYNDQDPVDKKRIDQMYQQSKFMSGEVTTWSDDGIILKRDKPPLEDGPKEEDYKQAVQDIDAEPNKPMGEAVTAGWVPELSTRPTDEDYRKHNPENKCVMCGRKFDTLQQWKDHMDKLGPHNSTTIGANEADSWDDLSPEEKEKHEKFLKDYYEQSFGGKMLRDKVDALDKGEKPPVKKHNYQTGQNEAHGTVPDWFTCPHCPLVFDTEQERNSHVENEHGDESADSNKLFESLVNDCGCDKGKEAFYGPLFQKLGIENDEEKSNDDTYDTVTKHPFTWQDKLKKKEDSEETKGVPKGIEPLEPSTQKPWNEWTDEEKERWKKEHPNAQGYEAKDIVNDMPGASRYYECGTCGDSFDTRDEFDQHKKDYPGKHDSPNTEYVKSQTKESFITEWDGMTPIQRYEWLAGKVGAFEVIEKFPGVVAYPWNKLDLGNQNKILELTESNTYSYSFQENNKKKALTEYHTDPADYPEPHPKSICDKCGEQYKDHDNSDHDFEGDGDYDDSDEQYDRKRDQELEDKYRNGENLKKKSEESIDNPTDKDIKDWWNGRNISQRQHAIDPNRLDNDESLRISGINYEDQSEEELPHIWIGFSFRHQESDMKDFLGYDVHEDSQVWWDTYNPSQRYHMIDPHKIIDGMMEFAMKNYIEMDQDEKEKVDQIYDQKHSETSSPTSKRLGETIAQEGGKGSGVHNWKKQFGYPEKKIESSEDVPIEKMGTKLNRKSEEGILSDYLHQKDYSYCNYCNARTRHEGGKCTNCPPVKLTNQRVEPKKNNDVPSYDASRVKTDYDDSLESLTRLGLENDQG